MTFKPVFFTHAARFAGLFHTRVLSRDGLHLAPKMISKAATARSKQGIRALDAYLRRLLLLLALTVEPGLKPDCTERPIQNRKRQLQTRNFSLNIFAQQREFPDLSPAFMMTTPEKADTNTLVSTQTILARLSALKALLDAPQVRARRLAFIIARARADRSGAQPLRHRVVFYLRRHRRSYKQSQPR